MMGSSTILPANDQGNNLLVKNVNGSMEVANIIDWSTVPHLITQVIMAGMG